MTNRSRGLCNLTQSNANALESLPLFVRAPLEMRETVNTYKART